jgi:hypothetical protein
VLGPAGLTVLAPGRAIAAKPTCALPGDRTLPVGLAEFGILPPGSATRAAGRKKTTYIGFNVTFKF